MFSIPQHFINCCVSACASASVRMSLLERVSLFLPLVAVQAVYVRYSYSREPNMRRS